MLRDVSLSVDELGHIIAKTLRHFADMEHQELPPLVYQLLLLSTKVNTSNYTSQKVEKLKNVSSQLIFCGIAMCHLQICYRTTDL